MIKKITAAVVVLILSTWFGLLGMRSGSGSIKASYSAEELREDFLQFRGYIENNHPRPYAFTDKDTFNRQFRAQYEKIKAPMSLRQFYCLLAPLKAQIGCGHAHLDYPEEYRHIMQRFKFPLILSFIDGKCYLRKKLRGSDDIPLFSEIMSINGIGIDDIRETLLSEIAADGHNRSFKTSALESCFQYYHGYHYGTPYEFRIEYRTVENGNIREAVIQAIPCSGLNYSNKKLRELDFQVDPEKNAAVLTIDSFNFYKEKNEVFFAFVDKAFTAIRKNRITPVVIDLRGNGGGDPFCAAYLWAHIIREPHPYFSEPYGKYATLSKPIEQADNHFPGDLFILIDGGIFSTTGHLCALLEYHKRGVFIGTETGGTYSCNADVKKFPLKHTGLVFKLATGTFSAVVEGIPEGQGIMPHYRVQSTIEDLRNGRDAVMEFVFEHLGDRKSTALPLI